MPTSSGPDPLTPWGEGTARYGRPPMEAARGARYSRHQHMGPPGPLWGALSQPPARRECDDLAGALRPWARYSKQHGHQGGTERPVFSVSVDGDGRDGAARYPARLTKTAGSLGEAEAASTGPHGPGIGTRWGVRALSGPRFGPGLAFALGCVLSSLLALFMHLAVSWSLRAPEAGPCTSSTVSYTTPGSSSQALTQTFTVAPSTSE